MKLEELFEAHNMKSFDREWLKERIDRFEQNFETNYRSFLKEAGYTLERIERIKEGRRKNIINSFIDDLYAHRGINKIEKLLLVRYGDKKFAGNIADILEKKNLHQSDALYILLEAKKMRGLTKEEIHEKILSLGQRGIVELEKIRQERLAEKKAREKAEHELHKMKTKLGQLKAQIAREQAGKAGTYDQGEKPSDTASKKRQPPQKEDVDLPTSSMHLHKKIRPSQQLPSDFKNDYEDTAPQYDQKRPDKWHIRP